MYVPTDQIVQVGSVNTRYWMEGNGSPVILIHGISNCIEDWLLNFEALAGQHCVYALDLIGHGRTDKPLSISYNLADFAHFVKDFMDTLNIPSAHLVGHSLGGAISLYLTMNYPSYVDRLVLVDPGGLDQEISIILRLLTVPGLGELMGTLFMQGDFEKHKAFQRQSWPDPEVVPDEMIRRKYEATLWQDIRKTYFKGLRSLGNIRGMKKSVYIPIVQGLSSIKKPVLVVWGKEDNLIPVSQTQIIEERIPQARIEIFENAGHDPMIVNPARFNQLVLDFLCE